MPSASCKNRKVYGAVRDLDEELLERSNSSDKDNDSSNSHNFGDDYSLEDSDTNDEEYIDLTKNNRSKRKKTVTALGEKKRKIETGMVKNAQKKVKKNKLSKDCGPEMSYRKNVASKVENEDDIKTSRGQKKETANLDSFDVVVPSSILKGGGSSSDNQCTLLVEVSDSKDAIALGEFGGSIGAIGRFESDPNGITLDLKGNQYRGSLLPGPTCLVVGFPQSFGTRRKDSTLEANGQPAPEEDDDKEAGTLRVDGIVDEYATLIQVDDHMKKLDAVVTENSNDNDIGGQGI